MRLIVGLGNPGVDYAATRHNIGFKVLDEVVSQLDLSWRESSKWEGVTAQTALHGQKVIFAKSHTYMNETGRCVKKILDFYKLDSSNLWTISDDLDLPLGRLRVRHSGSSGGHNGLTSIIESIGTPDFYRIRLGILQITDQPNNQLDASVFVLQSFDKREEPIAQTMVEEAAALIIKSLNDNELICHTTLPNLTKPRA